MITYTITDQDGQAASAFIHVPAVGDLAPRLIDTTGLEVDSGETVDVPLSDHVTVQGGGGVRITQADRVSAVHANGDALGEGHGHADLHLAGRLPRPDAITFEVTERDGPDDPDGRTSTLSIPVTVLLRTTSARIHRRCARGRAGDGPQSTDLAVLIDGHRSG